MYTDLRPALSMTILFTALLGLAYPLAMTGIAGAAFPEKAGGSLVLLDGKPVGSALIGQAFAGEGYVHGRPSATSDMPYNGASSTGTNLGPTSAKLKDMIGGEVARLREQGLSGPVPADAATASGSGLDPDISPAYAKAQVPRIAKARGAADKDVEAVILANTQRPAFGFLGEARVNVLALNIALDKAFPAR